MYLQFTLNNFSNWSLLFNCFLDIHKTNFFEFFSVLYRRILEPKPIKNNSFHDVMCSYIITDFQISGMTLSFEIYIWYG